MTDEQRKWLEQQSRRQRRWNLAYRLWVATGAFLLAADAWALWAYREWIIWTQ